MVISERRSNNDRMKGFAQKAEPQVLTHILDTRLLPLPGEVIPVEEAHRRIVADRICLPRTELLPRFFDDNTTHDCSSQDIPKCLPAGHRLRPMDLALLVFLEVREVVVYPQPRVALLITGNELLPCGSKPEGHRIVDSNSVMLAGLISRDGGMPLPALMIADDPTLIRDALQKCSADMIFISGGSSVGMEDHSADVLGSDGEICLHGVNMRPGAPLGFGFHAGRPVFLFPGNPVACLCAYDIFAGHAVRRLGGAMGAMPYPTRKLPFRGTIQSPIGRLDYIRVRMTGGVVESLHPSKGSGASILSSTTLADGFILVQPERDGVYDGEVVTVYLYGSINASQHCREVEL